MKAIEIRAQQQTATALALSFENLAEQFDRGNLDITFESIGSRAHRSVKQTCDYCGKERGLFYNYFQEDGTLKCIFCEQLELFGMNTKIIKKD